MWKLSESRRRFYSERAIPEENFWKTLFRQSDRRDVLDDERFKEYLNWIPNRANCPELELAMERLIDIAPVAWKATMRNIFVAREFREDANASAWSFRSSGVVELNYGFTTAAMIYTTLFCCFYDAMVVAHNYLVDDADDLEVLEMLLDEAHRGAFEPILIAEQSRVAWAEHNRVYPAHPALLELPYGRETSQYHSLVEAVEEFTIGHEVCHHMLGHTAESTRVSPIARVVEHWMERAGVRHYLEQLNPSQVQEIQADVGAFLLLSGELGDGVTRSGVYRSIGGSIIAITALAHISENWASADQADTHPDYITRYDILYRVAKELGMNVSIGEVGDHPAGFLLQLSGFISMVLQTWLAHVDEEIKRPNFLNIFSKLMEKNVELEEELRSLGLRPG